ncbi:cupin domain-containing protein [Streptomyces sp. NPDC001407]|uniref:cupin domain-containing protein n=1 Tax=unclassified Streptomyces TaxID=2593676 RepID=UPI0033C38C7E
MILAPATGSATAILERMVPSGVLHAECDDAQHWQLCEAERFRLTPPPDTETTLIVLEGDITLSLEETPPVNAHAGQVVLIPQNARGELHTQARRVRLLGLTTRGG